jgi:hypothetical protein
MSVSRAGGLNIPSYILYLVHIFPSTTYFVVVAMAHFKMTGRVGAMSTKFLSSISNHFYKTITKYTADA